MIIFREFISKFKSLHILHDHFQYAYIRKNLTIIEMSQLSHLPLLLCKGAGVWFVVFLGFFQEDCVCRLIQYVGFFHKDVCCECGRSGYFQRDVGVFQEDVWFFQIFEFISSSSLSAPFPSEKPSKLPFISGSSFSESSTYISGLDRPPKSGSSSLKSSGWMSVHIHFQNGYFIPLGTEVKVCTCWLNGAKISTALNQKINWFLFLIYKSSLKKTLSTHIVK